MKRVITYGSFDLFHEGHYKLLQRAKELGDYLIVGVTSHEYDEYRGKLNIVDSLKTRIEKVKSTGFADEIIIEDHLGQKIEDILKYDIDIFTVGSDWVGTFDYINEYCKVVYLERTKNISSTMLRENNHNIVKIGVIGTGRIARRFMTEIKYVSGINAEIVFNPNIKSAEQFAKDFQIYKYTDDMSFFLNNIDAVYIASPHETHFEYVQQSLKNAKHVLCEKPLALKKEDAISSFKLAKENDCILMEAIKTAYCPGFVQLVGIAKSGIIGKICDIEATFTKLSNLKEREFDKNQYGGSFTELGSYPLMAAVKLLGTNFENIRFDSILNDEGVDIYTKMSATIDNALVTCKTGIGVKSEGNLIISGTKGYIICESPWWKTQMFEARYENGESNEKFFNRFAGDGLRYEISDFLAGINGYRKSKLSREESVAISGMIEEFWKDKYNIKLNKR